MFILRHESRFPSATASLVEEVGQSVFVFTRVPGELDHDGLVFFHADGKRRYVEAGIRIFSIITVRIHGG